MQGLGMYDVQIRKNVKAVEKHNQVVQQFTVTTDNSKKFVKDITFSIREFTDANGNNLVQLPGASFDGWGEPVGADLVDRQVLIVREFSRPGGKKAYTVKGYSLCRRTEVGDLKMSKKDAETGDFTFKGLNDPFFMGVIDGLYQPINGMYEWKSEVAVYAAPTTQYTVGVGAASAGTFTLSYGGVGPSSTIAFNAAGSAVKSALVALDDGYTASDFSVSGSAPT